MSEREELAAVLIEHGGSGRVNSRENWIGCLCEARLDCELDSSGYPLDVDAEDTIRADHLAGTLLASPWLRAHDDRIRAEALAPVLALADEWERNLDGWGGCRHEWLSLARLRAAAGTPTHHTTEEDA